jgi:hypothetical protein
MKTPALIIALLLSTAAAGAASAADANAAKQPTRLAGWFDNVWDHEHHGERRHHGRHRDDDDDDDGERHGERHGDRDRDGGHDGRGGENRPADPNAANAPVPDNGVFTGKARPKVEVR